MNDQTQKAVDNDLPQLQWRCIAIYSSDYARPVRCINKAVRDRFCMVHHPERPMGRRSGVPNKTPLTILSPILYDADDCSTIDGVIKALGVILERIPRHVTSVGRGNEEQPMAPLSPNPSALPGS